MPNVYLDSSAIIKRYVEEVGTEMLNMVYSKADTAELTLTFSLWNIGEVLGALDQYRWRRSLTEASYIEAMKNFAGETMRLLRITRLSIIPVQSSILANCWEFILKYHLYEADAMQISSCKQSGANMLLSADKELIQAARTEGLRALNVESEQASITKAIWSKDF